MKKIFVILVSLAIAACNVIPPQQVYKGKRLNKKQEVVLSAEGKHSLEDFSQKKIHIEEVDGKSLRSFTASLTARTRFPYPHEVYLLPGQHTVKVLTNIGISYAEAILWFEAEAGKRYIVRSQTNGYSVQMWIEDGETKLRVGGVGYGSKYTPPVEEAEDDS